jgi:hypothetical protein
LLVQLLPAVLVTAAGVLVLGNLAKAPSAAPSPAPVTRAIQAEAVFTITPREVAVAESEDTTPEPVAKPAKAPVKPKTITASTIPSRVAINEAPRQTASDPLPIAPIIQQPQAVIETPRREGAIMRTLRGATAAVRSIPRWAANSMSGWLPEAEPPRPPAPIPLANFQASM